MKSNTIAPAARAGKIEVRSSGVHGRGVFATRRIRASELIAFYTGRRYAASEIASKDWDPRMTYVFGLSDGSLIDAREGGNDTRFINHACEPNCIAYEIDTARGPAVEIRAKTTVARGEELFLDYALDIADNAPADYVCRCASPGCRGTMSASGRG
ncbi:MAG: SET domain-containing protein-lysine N-methyltransferase [Burkholderiaceae bacterium]